VTTNGQIGMLGFFAGPGLHTLDGNGLTGAFIASLPTAPGWRVGHFGRYFPDRLRGEHALRGTT
jgi:hypothetical protein